MPENNNIFFRLFTKFPTGYLIRVFVLSRLSIIPAVLYGTVYMIMWRGNAENSSAEIGFIFHLLPVISVVWLSLLYIVYMRSLSDSRNLLLNAMVWDVSEFYEPAAKELLQLPRRLSIAGWVSGLAMLSLLASAAYLIQESVTMQAVLTVYLICLSALTLLTMTDYMIISRAVTPVLDWIRQKKTLRILNVPVSADESLMMYGLFLFITFLFFGLLTGIVSVKEDDKASIFWMLFIISAVLGMLVYIRRTRNWKKFDAYMTATAGKHEEEPLKDAVPELSVMLGKVEQVTGRFYELFLNIENDSSEMNAAAKVVSETSAEQNSALIRQSASVTQTSSTLQELVQASKQIAESASAVVGYAENTEKKADHGLRVMQDSVAHVQKVRDGNEISLSEVIVLSEAIIEIDQVLNFIISIADETNLIALNAAIEASSAGEQGKRFKIVANEVRELSTRVTKSIRTIKDITRKIQDATSKLVQTVQDHQEVIDESVQWVSQALVNLEEILEGAVQSADAAKQIYIAIQQQKIANQQIAISFNDISSDIRQIASSSDRYEQYVRTLRKFSSNIESALQSLNLEPIPGSDQEWNLR